MNNLALLACRKMLFLEVAEAAKYIGNVEARTWRYYEAGRSAIPEHIASKMIGFMQRRDSLLDELRQKAIDFRKRGEGRQAVPFYVSFEQYQEETGLDDFIEWRIDQSVKTRLYVDDLVVFY
ncbi:DUF1870 family protein [Enterobacter cloacae]|uniref:Aca2/YdiL-like domain-containing protein n=1 Tax=Enterobacter cloacae TaxID=550 RepID=UPI0013EFB1D1|nr:DUF1870 family protein [Enterobacter cloacae]